MKKKIWTFLVVLISIENIDLKGQTIFNYINDINARVAQIPYVFEGQVVSVEIYAGDDIGNPLPWSSVQWNGNIGYFYDAAGNEAQGYSKAKIKICKVYKGDISAGSEIEVLTRSFAIQNIYLLKDGSADAVDMEPKLRYMEVPTSHDPNGDFEIILPAANYKKKIYFADKVKPIVPTDYSGKRYQSNFHSLYELPFYETVDVQKPNGYWEKKVAYCALVPYVFDDQSQVQLFLNQIQTINPNPPDYCRSGTIKQDQPHTNDPIVDNSSAIKRFNDWYPVALEAAKIIQQNKVGKRTSSPDDVTYDIVNERLVNIGAVSWFEFDIYVNGNSSSIYLNQSLMRIQYNTSVFGNSVAVNNNVVVTPAPAFNIATYSNQFADWSNNVLGISIAPQTNTSLPMARVNLSTTPQIFCTVRMKITNCGSSVGLTFTDNVFCSMFGYFTTSANQSVLSPSSPFDNVYYVGTINDNACDVVISSFNNNIPAGIGRVLTINGKYFGTTKGNGTVMFKNADQGKVYPTTGGPYFGGVQPYDILSWTDTKIEVRLPNMVDSVFITNYPLRTNMHPGTGKFKVRNHAGDWAETTTELNIPWSIVQYNDNDGSLRYRKSVLKLVDQDSGGYRVRINNYVASTFSNAKPVTKKAMKDWSCATGIDWFIGSNTATTHLGDAITVQDTMVRPGVLMSTDRNPRTCPDPTDPPFGTISYMRSFDISMVENPLGGPWSFDTTGNINPGNYDYYHTISHELGHAHGIGHINDSIIDLMWFSATNGGYTFLQRKFVKPSTEAREGGNWVTDSLSAGALNCIGSHI